MVVVAPVSTSPELSPRPQRRTYTAKDKLRILADVDHAAGTGATGAILRREGQYHSNQGWQQAWGAGQTDGMPRPPDPHHRHLFPAEIISYAVWLYHVFSLSLRDVELILAERGVSQSYETQYDAVQEVRREFCRPPATSPATLACHLSPGRARPGAGIGG